ncbi:MAG: phosphopyruvate hydratase [Patescibacteria group bacterium]|jgi:enolase
MSNLKIKSISAHEILDSRGDPTVQTTVRLNNGTTGVAAVPSGASKGSSEAWELRDGDAKRYGGLGVLKACHHVNTIISKTLAGMNPADQRLIDHRMIELDGTVNKSRLGANAILSVSMAVARAAAQSKSEPLHKRIASLARLTKVPLKIPTPIFNVFNGGKHADTNIDLQEFWLVPVGPKSIADRVRLGAEVFHALKDVIHKDGRDTDVGNEGGYAPTVDRTTQVFDWMMTAIRLAGYRPGIDVGLGVDAGSTTFYNPKLNRYQLSADQRSYTTAELIKLYQQWASKYPIRWLEDGLREGDWTGWRQLTVTLGRRMTLIGDDLLCTNVRLLRQAIDAKVANALLVKLNQIGTLSETIDAVLLAKKNKYQVFVSHRSGETADDFIADLAVGIRAEYIKAGAPSRGERVVKYNRLMAIADELKKI